MGQVARRRRGVYCMGADPIAWAGAEGSRGLPHVPVPDVTSNRLGALPIPSAVAAQVLSPTAASTRTLGATTR
jgi:hypothetical protein